MSAPHLPVAPTLVASPRFDRGPTVILGVQRQEDGRIVIALRGAFDCTEAHRVLDVLARLPPCEHVCVDFHEAQAIDDFAFASFAEDVSIDRSASVELVGVSRHLDRLLRYLGPGRVLH